MLSENYVFELLESEKLIISPLLDRDEQINGGSVDLRLGVGFIIAKNNHLVSFDPIKVATGETPIDNFREKIYRPFTKPLILNPGEMALGTTLEYIRLPKKVYGTLTGRSSWGKLGLGIATGQLVRPGHIGCLTLELVNLGKSTIKMYPGMRIGQMVLYETEKAPRKKSRYDYSIGPQFSRLSMDPEIPSLGGELTNSLGYQNGTPHR